MVDIVSTIGIGRHFTTPAAWEAASQGSGNVQRGEMYADSVYTQGVTIQGMSSPSPTKHRELVAASGEEYNPVTDTGVKFNGTSVFVILNEDYCEVEHLGIIRIGAGRVFGSTIEPLGDIFIDSCFAKANGKDTGQDCFDFGSRAVVGRVFNCIAVNGDHGFINLAGVADINLHNFTAHECDIGVYQEGGDVANCIATSCVTIGFQGSSPDAVVNNISEDASAPGANSQSGITPESLFNDKDANDFRLLAGSAAVGSGIDISAQFTWDFANETRTVPWDVGAYKLVTIPGPTPTPAGSGILRIFGDSHIVAKSNGTRISKAMIRI